jgi:Tol biopolymer transport system component
VRSLFAIVIGILIVSLLTACGNPQLPAEPSSGIAFMSMRDGDKEIYLIQPDGSGLIRLTKDPATDTDPTWSPDGRQIAFVTRRLGTNDVAVMNPDGSDLTILVPDALETGFDEFMPTWSPDGETLAVVTDRYGFWGCAGHLVALLPPDGDKDDFRRPELIMGNQRSMAWSPDGRYLAYSSHCDSNTSISIYLWDRETGGNRPLIDHPSSNMYPAWSHDGRFLAFASNRTGNSEVFVLELATGELTNLTRHPAKDIYATWSPDDSQLAFATDRDGNREIYIVDADGSNPRNLTQHPGFDSLPAWSPVP